MSAALKSIESIAHELAGAAEALSTPGRPVPPFKTGPARAGELVTRCVAEIEAKPVSWLWPRRIARGKVTIIAGNPGLGKSQITASIAAIVTTGGRWPVDRATCVPGGVLFLSAEDDPADTLRPRLEAAGADLKKVHVMESVLAGLTGEGLEQRRAFSLQTDIAALSRRLDGIGGIAAVIIDPITSYLGDVDSHRNAEVRALLAPLSDLAARHGAAVVGVSHLNKSAGTDALMRVTGSLAFVAAARAAYLVAADPADKTRRLFLPMKNNIGPDDFGLSFCIEGAEVRTSGDFIQSSRIIWGAEPVATTADEVMRTPVAERESALSEAADWLREFLKTPRPVSEVFEASNRRGIAEKTIQRAAKSLSVSKTKAGMKGGWVWSIATPKISEDAEVAQQKDLGIFDDVGHLRGIGERVEEFEV